MFENQTLNKNRVLPSAMILDRLSIECIAKAATKEKIIESCCISSTKLVEQLVKSEPQYSKKVSLMKNINFGLKYVIPTQESITKPLKTTQKHKCSHGITNCTATVQSTRCGAME